MEITFTPGEELTPEKAVALLTLGVVEPGAQWPAAALATRIPCRACDEQLKVTPAQAPPEAVAVDGEGRILLDPASVSRDALQAQLCDPCHDLAGWENEHLDGEHELTPDPDCPICAERATP